MVQRALEGLDGVKEATVSFQPGEARVVFDETTVTVEDLIRAVTQLGFQATVKPQRAP